MGRRYGYAVACGLLVGLLTGCNVYDFRRSVSASPVEVRAHAAECGAAPVAGVTPAGIPVAGVTPVGYVLAGWDLVDQQCVIFFDNLTRLNQGTRYTASAISTTNTQTAAILAATAAAAKSIAIVAAVSELARRLVTDYGAIYGFAPYSAELRRLVFDALEGYRKEMSASLSDLKQHERYDDYCLAQNVVRNYAKICTISNIDALARQAIASAPIRPSSNLQPNRDAAPPLAGVAQVLGAPAPRGLMAPPNYIAGD